MTCHLCKTTVDHAKSENYNINKNIKLCQKCRDTNKIMNEIDVLMNYNLKKNDIIHLRTIYENTNNKLYLATDIEQYIKHSRISKKDLKFKLQDDRRQHIQNLFIDNKLNYNEQGDIYMYITTGKPDPEIIISNEIQKIDRQLQRYIQLVEYLENKGINYHNITQSNYISNICIDYITGSCTNFMKIINLIENEYSNNIVIDFN